MSFSRVHQARCILFGCSSACTKVLIAGEHWNWSVCRCGVEGAPDCCRLLWSSYVGAMNFSTTGSCPACNESGACTVKTIVVSTTADPETIQQLRETVALCSG